MAHDPMRILPLRGDLAWEVPADVATGPWRLVDNRLGRRLKLDVRGHEVACLMDRVQPVAALLARIAEGGRPMAEDALWRVVDAFDGLGLLDSDAVDRAADLRARMREDASVCPDDVPLLIPADLRFSCSACGSCCHGVNVGPVTPDVLAGLEGERREALTRDFGTARGLFFTMTPEGEDRDIVVCQTRNGACTFLEADGLCAIHRRYGEDAKPHVCRLFPYQFLRTPAGIAVGLQLECRDLLAASRGRPVAEQADSLRALLRLAGDIPIVRPFVSLDGEAALPYDGFEKLARDVTGAVEARAGGGFDTLLAIRGVLSSRCLAAGRPFPEAPAPADLKVAFYQLLKGLGERLVAMRSEHKMEGEGVKFHSANLEVVVDALTDVPLFASVVMASEDDPEAQRFARLALLEPWRAKDVVLPPDLVTATAEHALRWLLARAVAVSRARQVHRRLPLPQDLVDGWCLAHMLLRNRRVKAAVDPLRPVLADVLVHHLDALVAAREALADREKRTEFYLF